MKQLFLIIAALVICLSCKDNAKKKKSFSYETTPNTEQKPQNNLPRTSDDIPIDMSNKGIGPVKNISLGAIDKELVAEGQKIFKNSCTACHLIDKKLIGPPLTGIIKERSPEWIVNMILNTSEMLKKDPIAKKLFEKYKISMINHNLTKKQARAVLEYLRTI